MVLQSGVEDGAKICVAGIQEGSATSICLGGGAEKAWRSGDDGGGGRYFSIIADGRLPLTAEGSFSTLKRLKT